MLLSDIYIIHIGDNSKICLHHVNNVISYIQCDYL